MVVVSKALVRLSDGYVENIVLYDDDEAWEIPVGYELVNAENALAQPGAIWDGSKFEYSNLESSRLVVLMSQGPATKVLVESDVDGATPVYNNRPAEDIAKDKDELLKLLHDKLAETGDLSWDEMNKMLALERES